MTAPEMTRGRGRREEKVKRLEREVRREPYQGDKERRERRGEQKENGR